MRSFALACVCVAWTVGCDGDPVVEVDGGIGDAGPIEEVDASTEDAAMADAGAVDASTGDASAGLDECALGTDDCSDDAVCTDTPDGFTCACAEGFTGDGRTCADIDECTEGTDDCSALRQCANVDGGFECRCPAGSVEHGGECVQLSVGLTHTCLVRDGALRCWGQNGSGQLGLGDLDYRLTPTPVEGDDWQGVTAGDSITCGIRAPGSLWCWSDAYETIGSLDPAELRTPSRVGDDDDWAAVSAGSSHVCAIKRDGSLYCWGEDSDGVLGNGPEDEDGRDAPARVGTSTGWVAVVVGSAFTCALDASGDVYCWGDDAAGQLGNGAELTETVHAPARVPGLSGVVSLGAGVSDPVVCAITSANELHCWGENAVGQTGNGDTTDLASPTRIDGTFTAVAAGATSCAIDAMGDLFCWGANAHGQRGAGDRDMAVAPPQRVDATRDWLEVGTGVAHACGLADDGSGRATVLCWGRNFGGTLGIGEDTFEPAPTRVAGTWLAVAAGDGHTCAIAADHSLSCWGSNQSDELGGYSPNLLEDLPQPIGPGSTWASLSAGAAHSCAIERLADGGAGRLYCWGGLGRPSRPTPIGSDEGWRQVSVGDGHACAILGAPGRLYCWGRNSSGQLGTGDQLDRTAPTDVGDLSADGEDWYQVAAGGAHTCAVLQEEQLDGRYRPALYCLGSNYSGEVGVADGGDLVLSPVRVDSGSEWEIATGYGHSCRLDDGGQLSCWGLNAVGQLGLGDFDDRDAPTSNPSPLEWSSISAGGTHTCGIATVGIRQQGLFCFGVNLYGQLGIGTFGPGPDARVSTPTRVGTGTRWQQVSAGRDHSCAIDSVGVLSCWGSNAHGQLGIGTVYRTEPVAVVE